jgi:phosphoribosylanthranilate isomerase
VSVRVKICGVTSIGDAEACALAGADWLGLNFVPSSPRCISAEAARAISRAVRVRSDRAPMEIIGVVAARSTADEAALRRLLEEAELDRLQLHGDEPPELVHALAPRAFKAVRVGSHADAEAALLFEGLLLLDAFVPGALGGTGKRLDTSLAEPIARKRDVLLAGGLDPSNVAEAIRAVRPWGVDVASGVESAPGVKDHAKVRAFVEAARA